MEQFSYVKRGYSPEEVNKYIATLEQVIKSYKEKDNAIKNAIISAQVAADNVIRNAHAQALEYKKKISQQLLQVSSAIEAERLRLQAFHDVYMGLMQKYLFEISSADMHEMSRRLDDMDSLISDLLSMEVPPIGDASPLLSMHEDEVKETVSPLPEPAAYEAPVEAVQEPAQEPEVNEPLPEPQEFEPEPQVAYQAPEPKSDVQVIEPEEPPVAPPQRYV